MTAAVASNIPAIPIAQRLLPGVNPLVEAPGLLDDKLNDSEELKVGLWLEKWIKRGNIYNGKTLQTALSEVFGDSKAIELASRVRAELDQRNLLDYVKIDKPLIVFDLETAGKDGNDRRIIEISLIKYYPDDRQETFTQRINPTVPINKHATEKHGITDNDVKDCLTFKQMAPALFEIFKDSHLAGFNIRGFDIPILIKEFKLAGMEFGVEDKALIDAMSIYHQREPFVKGKKRNLTAAYKFYCGKVLENAHTAKADTCATAEVIKGQFEKYSLPGDVYELSDYCEFKNSDFLDPDGKFMWVDGEVVVNFGNKHRNETLKEVAENDKNYLEWMLRDDTDFAEETRDIVRNALDGSFPIPPKKK